MGEITQHFPNPVILHNYPPMKMEQTECSETSAYKIQTPGNYPEESIQHSEHGDSLKSRWLSSFWNSKITSRHPSFCFDIYNIFVARPIAPESTFRLVLPELLHGIVLETKQWLYWIYWTFTSCCTLAYETRYMTWWSNVKQWTKEEIIMSSLVY